MEHTEHLFGRAQALHDRGDHARAADLMCEVICAASSQEFRARAMALFRLYSTAATGSRPEWAMDAGPGSAAAADASHDGNRQDSILTTAPEHSSLVPEATSKRGRGDADFISELGVGWHRRMADNSIPPEAALPRRFASDVAGYLRLATPPVSLSRDLTMRITEVAERLEFLAPERNQDDVLEVLQDAAGDFGRTREGMAAFTAMVTLCYVHDFLNASRAREAAARSGIVGMHARSLHELLAGGD